jgi:hypothetical protein
MDALKAILSSNTLGFSKPIYLNDPFDQPNGPDVPDYGFLGSLSASMKNHAWANNTVVCSLTRTVKNALMWAHYADSHKGAAIEIDAAACGLFDVETNLIPAHLGSVIYVREPDLDQYVTKPQRPVTVGRETEFRLDRYEQLQRTFLTKPLDWAYEEEVRVVKGIHDLKDGASASGRFSVIPVNGRELHALHIPAEAITKVYLGVRVEATQAAEIVRFVPGDRLHMCGRSRSSYEISTAPFVVHGRRSFSLRIPE